MTDAARILSDVRSMCPLLGTRSREFEADRRIPVDVIDRLKEIGVFQMLVPRSHGGLELDLATIVSVIVELARADASTAWTAMIGSGSTLYASMLPKRVYDAIYVAGPDVVFAGSTQLLGTARRIDAGWHVSGRWPFASGCLHADWIIGFCAVEADDPAQPGPPRTLAVVLPASRWRIDDSWHVPGLKATASHHVALDREIVATDCLFDLATGWPWLEGPLYTGVHQILSLLHAAVSLGIAQAALADIVTLARSGRRQHLAPAPMRDSEIFQVELGRAQADVRAAEALLMAQVDSHWCAARAGTLATPAKLIEGSQTAIWVADTCRRATDTCFALGSSAALYDHSPLQRRMRDMRVAAQHSYVQPRQYSKAGALLLGTEPA